MNSLKAAVRQVASLFLDDGSLALQIVAIILIAGASSSLFPQLSNLAGGVLLFGSLGALFVSVAKERGR